MGNEDAPFYPHVKCEKCGIVTVRWGRGGRWFIYALAGLLLASGTMTYRVSASEQDTETMQKNIKILNSNLGKIDERQRIAEAGDGLMASQMRALLEKVGVTERIEPPAVEDSTLEELEP